MPAGTTFAVADVNGRPTVLVRNADGSAAFVVSVEIDDGRVESIWAIANPDKLHRVNALHAHAAARLN
jgi:RNA polymerase sigma-70 factor (ECF subfamily)